MISPYRIAAPRAPRKPGPAFVAGAMVAALFLGCSGGAGPQPNIVTPGVNFAVCVLTTAAVDISAGMTPVQVTADLLSKCGGDLVSIANILDADARAHDAGASGTAFAQVAAAARASASDAGRE